MERTRTRVFSTRIARLADWYYTFGEERKYVIFVGRETTIDEEHPWYRWRDVQRLVKKSGGTLVADIGGNFTTTKTFGEATGDIAALQASPHLGKYLYNFKGQLIPSVPVVSTIKSDVMRHCPGPFEANATFVSHDFAQTYLDKWPSVSNTDAELATLGASLVSKLSPTAPHNNVYTSLGELRNDGLPSIPFLSFLRKGGKLPEKVGDEWLNYQFAIAPTVADVKSIYETVKKADKLWKQYLRDSGRLVRRRFDMDPIVSTESGVLNANSSGVHIPMETTPGMWSSVGPIMHTTTTTRKRSFSAAYMYYVSPDSLSGMDGWLERAQYLYGWKPSPSGVYNLTAWSWLLDWFTNTGDVIDNISLYLEDPFLSRWAYIMEETSVTRTIWQSLLGSDGRHYIASMRFTTHIKKRRKVNPFHLGLKGEALTLRQLSILAALGLTKGRNPGSM